MKKIYQNPTMTIVELNGGAVCETLVIGSGKTPQGSGDGTDLTKESGSWGNVWGSDDDDE